MSRVNKIKKILNSLNYTEKDCLNFILRRFEKVDRIHTKFDNKKEDEIMKIFELFHKRYHVRVVGNNFPSSSGKLVMKDFFDFLEEYDEKFNLDWCELDFKEIVIKPVYL